MSACIFYSPPPIRRTLETTCTVKRRLITWTINMERDMRKWFDSGMEKEIMEALAKEIVKDIDDAIMSKLITEL